MAISAIISIPSPSNFVPGQLIPVKLTVTNGNTTPTKILLISPFVQSQNGGVAALQQQIPVHTGQPAFVPSGNPWVQNGLANVYNWNTTVYGPLTKSGGASDLGGLASFAPASISSIVQTGNLCTVTTSAGHGIPAGLPVNVQITGNTIGGQIPFYPDGYNGIQQVTGVPSATTFTFNAPTPNQATSDAAGSVQIIGVWNYGVGAVINFSDTAPLITGVQSFSIFAPTF